jgi:hypothetical protein
MKKSTSNPNWLQKSIVVILTLGLFVGITTLTYIEQPEPEPTSSYSITGNALMVSEKYMWNLNLNEFLLNTLYEQAYNLAVLEIPDAALCEFAIDVMPYSPSSKVRITYCFYSASADRELDYFFNDKLEINLERDISGTTIVNKVTFESLPWVTIEDWKLPIKTACEIVGPLTPGLATGYLVWVTNSPKLTWHINIGDRVNWHWTLFKWYGQGDLVLVKKYGEDVEISRIIYYP